MNVPENIKLKHSETSKIIKLLISGGYRGIYQKKHQIYVGCNRVVIGLYIGKDIIYINGFNLNHLALLSLHLQKVVYVIE